MNRNSPHTRCHKGKRVLVTLRDGRRLEDHFEGYTSRAIVLRRVGRVRKCDLRALCIARTARDLAGTGGR